MMFNFVLFCCKNCNTLKFKSIYTLLKFVENFEYRFFIIFKYVNCKKILDSKIQGTIVCAGAVENHDHTTGYGNILTNLFTLLGNLKFKPTF